MAEGQSEKVISIRIGQSLTVPGYLRTIQDPFSQELIGLWDSRKLEGKIYTLRDEEKLVGYILVEELGPECTIRGFYILPEFRGQGYGTGFLISVCKILEKREGRGPIYVNITDGAQKVYTECGFIILGRRKDFTDQWIAFKGVLTDSQERALEKKILHGK